MIDPHYIWSAALEISDPKAKDQLKQIEAIAAELALLGHALPGKIAEHRSRRGEKPEKLSGDQKSVLGEVDEELANFEREQLEIFR